MAPKVARIFGCIHKVFAAMYLLPCACLLQTIGFTVFGCIMICSVSVNLMLQCACTTIDFLYPLLYFVSLSSAMFLLQNTDENIIVVQAQMTPQK